jgi:hypothetical protein
MAKKKEDAVKKKQTKPRHKFPNKKPDLIPPPKNKGGRPTAFTPQLAAQICKLIADGNSLVAIEGLPGMPTRQTVMNWYFSEKFPNFNILYDRAREMRADFLFEQSIDIADATPNQIVGDDKSDGARVQAQKLRLETRKWFTSVLAPRRYAGTTKVDVTSGGKKIKEPRSVTINYVVPQ